MAVQQGVRRVKVHTGLVAQPSAACIHVPTFGRWWPCSCSVRFHPIAAIFKALRPLILAAFGFRAATWRIRMLKRLMHKEGPPQHFFLSTYRTNQHNTFLAFIRHTPWRPSLPAMARPFARNICPRCVSRRGRGGEAAQAHGLAAANQGAMQAPAHIYFLIDTHIHIYI